VSDKRTGECLIKHAVSIGWYWDEPMGGKRRRYSSHFLRTETSLAADLRLFNQEREREKERERERERER